MKTYWKEISKLEEEIAQGNPEPLIKFIQYLAEKKLLSSHMLSGICDSSFNMNNTWHALHTFAARVDK